MIHICSDSLYKPLVHICFNGFCWPMISQCSHMTKGCVVILTPLLDLLRAVVATVTKCVAAFRPIQVNTASHKHHSNAWHNYTQPASNQHFNTLIVMLYMYNVHVCQLNRQICPLIIENLLCSQKSSVHLQYVLLSVVTWFIWHS